jgi:hypothetical protein
LWIAARAYLGASVVASSYLCIGTTMIYHYADEMLHENSSRFRTITEYSHISHIYL